MSYSDTTITYTDDKGREWDAKIGRIRRTTFGWTDHGCLTCRLDLDYGGAGQNAGGEIVLDDVPAEREIGARRRGTAFGMEYVAAIMRAVGVKSWEDLPGKYVVALGVTGIGSGPVEGLAPMPDVKGEAFVFADLANEMGADG